MTSYLVIFVLFLKLNLSTSKNIFFTTNATTRAITKDNATSIIVYGITQTKYPLVDVIFPANITWTILSPNISATKKISKLTLEIFCNKFFILTDFISISSDIENNKYTIITVGKAL